MKNVLLLLIAINLSGCWITDTKSKKSASSSETSKSRTIAQTADDLRISTAIHVDLYCLDLYKPIDVKVKNGVVYYTGSVSSRKESFAASGIAWKQNGVKDVVNDLKIESKNSKSTK